MAEIITEPERPHVVHHYDDDRNSSGAWVALVGIALLVVMALLFFYYGLPLLNRPSTTQIVPQVNVPDKVDVNVNRGQ